MNKWVVWSVAVLLAAGSVQAAPTIEIGDTVEVVYVKTSPGVPANVVMPVYTGSLIAGFQNITVDGVPMQSFCIDFRELASSVALPYTVAALEDAPVVGPAMGEANAMDIMKVYTWWENSSRTPLDAGVAQVVVWEILDNRDFLTGEFVLNTAGLRAQAQNLLNALPDLTDFTPLLALVNEGSQDFAIPFVPVPGAVLLGSFGLVLVSWSRRHKML